MDVYVRDDEGLGRVTWDTRTICISSTLLNTELDSGGVLVLYVPRIVHDFSSNIMIPKIIRITISHHGIFDLDGIDPLVCPAVVVIPPWAPGTP